MLLFFIISYNFFINDFNDLESKQNENNINTVLNVINNNLKSIENIVNDYSKWDDSYDFSYDGNKEYIYENFREGTNTLQDLDLDFILYITNDNKILFSKYENQSLSKNKQSFETQLLDSIDKEKAFHKLYRFQDTVLYFVKSEILKSDFSGTSNGWIFSGKVMSNDELNSITKAFINVSFSFSQSPIHKHHNNLSHLDNIHIDTMLGKNIINYIQFFNKDDSFIFTIQTESIRSITNKGKKTIFIFNIMIGFFVFLILFIIYKNQHRMEKYNKLLEHQVNKRTDQLTSTLRKLKNKNRELYGLANIDTLTKIKNRRSFFMQSEKLLTKSIEKNLDFTVMMIDIDHFKKVNDSYGHSIGDKVLIEFCQTVNRIIDNTAIFGRLGGEEFAITFYNQPFEKVETTAEAIRKACEESIINIENKSIRFTVSIGISSKDNLDSIDEILNHADSFLYKAKESGRNRIIRRTPHTV